MKLILIRVFVIVLLSVLSTALIKSIYMQDWLFVGLYIGILLTLKNYAAVMNHLEQERKKQEIAEKFKDMFGGGNGE